MKNTLAVTILFFAGTSHAAVEHGTGNISGSGTGNAVEHGTSNAVEHGTGNVTGSGTSNVSSSGSGNSQIMFKLRELACDMGLQFACEPLNR